MPIIRSQKTDGAQLASLAQLISSAVTTILSEYDAAGEVMPSLDSVEPGPFDTPQSQSESLVKTIRIIEAACGQLAASVASPGHTMFNRCYGYKEPACLQVVTEAKIANMLLDKPEGLHVDSLSEKSGLEAGKLSRILRLLATRHCFREVQPNVFANNRLSMKLVAPDPVWSYIGHLTDEGIKATAYLNEALTDPKSGHSYAIEDSAFYRMEGCTVYYATPAGRKRGERFAGAMKGLGAVTGKHILPKVYPWGHLSQDAVICDVGGNTGHVSLDLIQAFPQLKVVVQDMSHVVLQAQEFWTKEHPTAVKEERVSFAPLDFFTESPKQGCDVYYVSIILWPSKNCPDDNDRKFGISCRDHLSDAPLSSIDVHVDRHDWPDAECVKILENVRKAMNPTSRVLIHEFVLQHVVRVSASEGPHIEQAPEPLLPNYGMGRIRPYQQDLNMMSFLNSKERTLEEFITLGEQVGLKFAKLWDAGETSLVELLPV